MGDQDDRGAGSGRGDDTAARTRDMVDGAVGKPPLALSTRQVAAQARLTLEQAEAVRLASGFGPIDPDQPAYALEDVETFEVMRLAGELFSWGEAVGFTRVLGSSLARVAEAANSMFREMVETPMLGSGATPEDVATRAVEAYALAQRLSGVVRLLMRQHLDLAVERSRQAFEFGESDGPVESGMIPLAVGFIDLVGFTSRSSGLGARDLTELVDRFETQAHDTVTRLGGRLVKLIGDEVMFTAVEPSTAVRIAAALLDRFADDPALTPRGGLAYGPVVSRRGDLFGPVVNLASRLVDEAVPGEVLLTTAAAAHTPLPVEPAGRRMVKGFADPVTVMSLSR